MAEKSAFEKWAEYYKNFADSGVELLWPSETLIRVFKGDYIPDLDRNYDGKSVLDVGFGNGNNLIFLASLGLDLSGMEVHADICDTVSEKLQKLGHKADLRVGSNRAIPFDDDRFDLLVSWNVIHYENTEETMRRAIAEYQRVLKPGGRLLLSTAGPQHKLLQNSKTLGGHRYEIGRNDDFRKGQVYFYFDAPNYIQHYFSDFFNDVLVGRTISELFTEALDFFIVTAVKKEKHPTP